MAQDASSNRNSPPSDLVDDVHLGVSEMDTDPVFPSSDEREVEDEYPFDLRVEAVFNRLASEIYETESAGIREALTNAVTSILRARRQGFISDDEGAIEFRLYDGAGDDPGYLTLRDNGMGMSLDEINEVVSVIGATTVRQDGDLTGQFGMGFLALYKLVGLNGSFVMHSNSRLNDDPPFTGVWRSRGFTHDSEQRMDCPFDDNEYGVRFDFPLRPELSAGQVANWVYDIAEWSRVPVIFERYSADGELIEDDELGGRQFSQVVSDEATYVEYEDEFVHAAAGPDGVPNQTLLLDVPIARSLSYGRRRELPWSRPNLFVRLKNEKRPVVDGPNKGEMVANPKEYDVLVEQGIADGFISERDLHRDDVVMPAPLGNRDRLEDNNEFWEWLTGKLIDAYRQDVRDVVTSIDSPTDAYTVDDSDYELLKNVLPEPPVDDDDTSEHDNCIDVGAYRQELESAFDASFPDDDLVEALNAFMVELPMIEHGVSDAASSRNHKDTLLLDVFRETVRDEQEHGVVYIGSTINNKKAAVVWEDNSANQIVAAPSTEWYETLEELDTEYLKTIRASNLDQYEISERTRERFLEPQDDSDSVVEDGTVTLHFGRHPKKRSRTRRETIDIEELVEQAQTGTFSFGDYEPTRIVGFPRSSSWNLSEHRARLSSPSTAVASFTAPEWEHVREYDGIVGIEEYVEQAQETVLQTSRGSGTLPELAEVGDVLIHAVQDDVAPLFRTEERMQALETAFEEDGWGLNARFWGLDEGVRNNDTLVYAPVDETTFRQLLPVLDDYSVFVVGSEVSYARDDPGVLISAPRDASLYAIANLPEYQQKETLAIVEAGIERRSVSLSENLEAVDEIIQALKNT